MQLHRDSYVLIVDDEPHMRTFVRRCLQERFATEILEAADGESALRQARETPPSAVLLDLNLPGMGGLETLRMLRAEFPALPIVIFTAEATRTSVQECLEAGATAFVRKDTPLEQILRVFESTITAPVQAGSCQSDS